MKEYLCEWFGAGGRRLDLPLGHAHKMTSHTVPASLITYTPRNRRQFRQVISSNSCTVNPIERRVMPTGCSLATKG